MDGCFWESQYFSRTTVTISSIFTCENSLFKSNDNMYNKWEHYPILLNVTGRQNGFLILMKEDRALFVSNRSIVLWCKCNECIVILCKAMNSIWFDPDPHNFYISQFHNTLHSLHRSWSPRHVSRLSRVTIVTCHVLTTMSSQLAMLVSRPPAPALASSAARVLMCAM